MATLLRLKKRIQGFTILETILSIAVLLVVASIAFISYNSIISNIKEDSFKINITEIFESISDEILVSGQTTGNISDISTNDFSSWTGTWVYDEGDIFLFGASDGNCAISIDSVAVKEEFECIGDFIILPLP